MLVLLVMVMVKLTHAQAGSGNADAVSAAKNGVRDVQFRSMVCFPI